MEVNENVEVLEYEKFEDGLEEPSEFRGLDKGIYTVRLAKPLKEHAVRKVVVSGDSGDLALYYMTIELEDEKGKRYYQDVRVGKESNGVKKMSNNFREIRKLDTNDFKQLVVKEKTQTFSDGTKTFLEFTVY